MQEQTKLKAPWLIAAWPGMGNVAVGAVSYLIDQLGVPMRHELPASEFFPPNHVDVRNGVATPARPPRCIIFEWKSEDDWHEHDLILFLGEAQPETNGNALCQRVLDYANQRGVSRVFTFAAMATQLHPSAEPMTFGAVTERSMLNELTDLGVEVLEGGQIGGLNGLMLAACKQRRIPAGCLLGELPFFASGIPNPKASRAVLEIFVKLMGIEIDFAKLDYACNEIEEVLLRLLKKLQANHDQEHQNINTDDLIDGGSYESSEEDHEEPISADEDTIKLTESDEQLVEDLFEQAQEDRKHAFQLKQELDRLGIFDQYQDRFLDLFKRAD